MLFLEDKSIQSLALDWPVICNAIRDCVDIHNNGDFVQPIKPYLRFGDPSSRIIAMPAYLGGERPVCGIKWIASFPSNSNRGLPRAHAITILNDVDTGVPACIISTARTSAIRTAAVSGAVLRQAAAQRWSRGMRAGICGYGPIGKLHALMLESLFGDRLIELKVYDPHPEVFASRTEDRIKPCSHWREAYDNADVFITCTVSPYRYIDASPKAGSVHLNVSLRDYFQPILKSFDIIAVDSWEEVCRENTDIHVANRESGLNQNHVQDLTRIMDADFWKQLPEASTLAFNPMGMAIFDMVVCQHFYQQAKRLGIGLYVNN